METPIDFVVTWLDSTDPEWQEAYRKARGVEMLNDAGRYRNWGLFKYWFRAVETYAPWVNKVFLVTNGKNPDWINANHPKLVLVSHKDYIPEKYLPTFNSITIELNMNKILGLSEHFVYFNDDFYINSPVEPEYYFKGGLPCDCNNETYAINPSYSKEDGFSTKQYLFCDMAVLNSHFDRREVIKGERKRWFGFHLSKQSLITSFLLRQNKYFQFFGWRHYEQPMLKSVIDEIWEKEPYWMDKSCTPFRAEIGLNPYIIRYWQFATNRFYPSKINKGIHVNVQNNNITSVIQKLKDRRYNSLCINDTPYCTQEEFETVREALHLAFEHKFPHKSAFEI